MKGSFLAILPCPVYNEILPIVNQCLNLFQTVIDIHHIMFIRIAEPIHIESFSHVLPLSYNL